MCQQSKEDDEKLKKVKKEDYIDKDGDNESNTILISKKLHEEVIIMSEIYFSVIKPFLPNLWRQF